MQITTANVEFTRNLKVADYEHAKFTAGLTAELEPNDTPAGTLAALNHHVQNAVWTALGHPEKAPQAPAEPEQTGATAALETRTAGHDNDVQTAEPKQEQPAEDQDREDLGRENQGQDQDREDLGRETEPVGTYYTDEQLIDLASRAAEHSGVKAVQDTAAEFGVKRLQELEGEPRAQAVQKLEALT